MSDWMVEIKRGGFFETHAGPYSSFAKAKAAAARVGVSEYHVRTMRVVCEEPRWIATAVFRPRSRATWVPHPGNMQEIAP